MIDTDALQESICKTFCGDLSVKTLPSSIAVTTTFRDAVSDPIACFIERDNDGWFMTDDGHFLSDTIARGIDIQSGSRKDFLDRILAPVGAWCDMGNFEIRTHIRDSLPLPGEILQFITALVRARDVTFWSRERVRSTFKDDAYQALLERFATRAEVRRSAPVDASLEEFPADAILRPRDQKDSPFPITAVFFVQVRDTLNEALMLWMEARDQHRSDIRVTALVEDGTINLSSYKAQRAFNRIDTTAIFRGDERAAIDRIERIALPTAA
jgi:Domain of unknown function DUF1828